MTTKRKAELQRKLALAPVPKPPAGLADRIKGEIPKSLMLDTAKERTRFRQAIAFNMRVAASIILLVSSVYLALHLLSRRFGPQEMASTAVKETASAAPVALPNAPPPPMSEEAKQEARQRKPIVVAESRRDILDAPGVKKQVETSRGNATDNVTTNAEAPAAGRAGYIAPPPPPPLAVAAPAAASAAAPRPEPAAQPQVSESITFDAPRVATKSAAASFAFDVEASAAPFDAAKQIVRVSTGDHETAPDVAFNDDAVASWHTLATDGTSLYEITLRPHVVVNDVIATVRLGSGERVIRYGDVHSWSDASRRMKAASLAAALEAGVPPKDVAAKARAAGLDDVAAAADARARKQP